MPKADENTRGFEVALVWYTLADGTTKKWTKRVMIMSTKKATSLLREPNKEDLRIIEKVKSAVNSIPVSSASRDGEFTMPV